MIYTCCLYRHTHANSYVATWQPCCTIAQGAAPAVHAGGDEIQVNGSRASTAGAPKPEGSPTIVVKRAPAPLPVPIAAPASRPVRQVIIDAEGIVSTVQSGLQAGPTPTAQQPAARKFPVPPPPPPAATIAPMSASRCVVGTYECVHVVGIAGVALCHVQHITCSLESSVWRKHGDDCAPIMCINDVHQF